MRSTVLIWIVALTCAAVVGFPLSGALPAEVSYYLAPTVAAISTFAIFSTFLRGLVGTNLFGELGFIYLVLAVAYTIVPALSFTFIGLVESGPLAELLPSPADLATHLWRHVLFIACVAMGYLLVRGTRKLDSVSAGKPKAVDHYTICFLVAFACGGAWCLSLLSAPVESYYENYIRYDHLSTVVRKFVSVLVRLSLGIYTVILVLLFLNYKRYKRLIPLVVATICIYETVYSFGSRIYAFVILLETAWLYHTFVRPMTLKRAAIMGVAVVSIFAAVEIIRPLTAERDTAQDLLVEEGIRAPSELSAVFLTSFHLYDERSRGALPPKEWPMLFSDFISLVTFADFKRWDPMDWYTRNYHPDALVPPLTLGPLADSALWGGEFDLLMRGLINGAFFAALVRWFLVRTGKWWTTATYVYCYAMSVATLKYSVLYILTPLLKTVLPTLLLVAVFRKLILVKPTAVESLDGASKPLSSQHGHSR
jgi:hypothetical protein